MFDKSELSLIELGLYYYKDILKERIRDTKEELEYCIKLDTNNYSSERLLDWYEEQEEYSTTIKESEEYIKQIDETLIKLKILFKGDK